MRSSPGESLDEKGILVRTIESTDPKASSKRLFLLLEWVSLPAVALIILGAMLLTDVEGDEYWIVLLGNC